MSHHVAVAVRSTNSSIHPRGGAHHKGNNNNITTTMNTTMTQPRPKAAVLVQPPPSLGKHHLQHSTTEAVRLALYAKNASAEHSRIIVTRQGQRRQLPLALDSIMSKTISIALETEVGNLPLLSCWTLLQYQKHP